ncbi:hypothetical protein C8J57DRAFT_1627790 [Mycena rebaudengoi]|nr:hypothetical protein C8J57DRAFT_1627790 [Mycena rebaudengoi]
MQFKFAILAAFVSAAVAEICNLPGTFTIVTNAQSPLTTRWDVFTKQSGAVQVGGVGWFNNNQPNANEKFTSFAAGSPGRVTFARSGGQNIGVSGNILLASTGAAVFDVVCGSCFGTSGAGQVVGENCSIQLVNNNIPTGLCVNYQSDSVARVLRCDDNNTNQNIFIFSA